MRTETETLESVKEYYGKILRSNQDLKTNACCPAGALPVHLKEMAKEVPPEVQEKFYGCGSPIPAVLEGATVLDLGCGTGRDTFLLSKLAGPQGRVIGIDMTREQLEVARRNIRFPNVTFLKGYLEDLEGLGVGNHSVDAVVSNCVINLSPDKRRVFSEIFRVLKPGGELYFSDIFSGRRIPKHVADDPVLRGECLGGALYVEDFRRLLSEAGCRDYRVVSRSKVTLTNPGIAAKAGAVDFYSMTIRAFKLKLEDRCEDYGQAARYLGTLPECLAAFTLDDHHVFEKGKFVPVCGNTAAMLQETRYAPHFEVVGDRSIHYGLFDCGEAKGEVGGACCD
jgi:SAM-dependent methyltransferase